MVSERGRYCSSGVLSFRRMRVNLPVDGSLDSSQMPAQLCLLLAVFQETVWEQAIGLHPPFETGLALVRRDSRSLSKASCRLAYRVSRGDQSSSTRGNRIFRKYKTL